MTPKVYESDGSQYYNVTHIIGPKKPITEVILEVEVTIPDFLELETIASQRNESLDDLLRNAVHEYVCRHGTVAQNTH